MGATKKGSRLTHYLKFLILLREQKIFSRYQYQPLIPRKYFSRTIDFSENCDTMTDRKTEKPKGGRK